MIREKLLILDNKIMHFIAMSAPDNKLQYFLQRENLHLSVVVIQNINTKYRTLNPIG